MDKKKIIPIVVVMAIIAVVSSALIPVSAAYTYNRQNAVNYAVDNWNSNVPGSWWFNSHGGDCTNFVSWCLNEGGWPMRGLSYSTNYQWYMYGNPWPYSNSWTCADDFSKFLAIYSGRGYARSLAHHPWNEYFETGDIVQIDKDNNGRWDHTMIVTGINGDEMYMTYHTTNTLNKPLTQVISETLDDYPNARFMGYHLEDSFGW